MLRVVLYVVAIFSSAFLIFLVQPMVGKRILPWFGGVPAVWSVCLAFYQVALFVGYVYAHGMIRFVPARLHFWIHAAFFGTALACLPVLPVTPPSAEEMREPASAVLGLLASNVALPFIALAATGPLVQAWFARAHPTLSPYPLYAVSNVGSLAALVGYPFVIEPLLPLSDLGRLWGHGLIAAGVAIVACAWPASTATPSDGGRRVEEPDPAPPRIDPVQYPIWLLLSAIAVVLLMGVTNKLCLDVASVPFLWIVPLGVYLLTFILAFSTDRAYHRPSFVLAAIVSLVATRLLHFETYIVYQVLAYCSLLFAGCMVLHGELHRARPAPAALTAFYLVVATGGALGGLFAGIVAPAVFDDYYELEVGLIAGIVLIPLVVARDRAGLLGSSRPMRNRIAAAAVALSLTTFVLVYQSDPAAPNIVHRERSFFGVLVVSEPREGSTPTYFLTNGTTSHGLQLKEPRKKRIPTTYYGRATGLGLALTSRPIDGESKIGVIGLGVGTLAAYGRKGDAIRFYEIDPTVVRLAGKDGYFSYVEDSLADVQIAVGDARRSLEREQAENGSQAFDFLVIDAFSSDSIPVHLMTREAFAVYFAALSPNGLMAVHVSNRHFDLLRLVSRIADEMGAHSLQIWTGPSSALHSSLSEWVIIGREADNLTRLRIRIEKRHRSMGLPPSSIALQRGVDNRLHSVPVWTDDYSDVLSVIRRR